MSAGNSDANQIGFQLYLKTMLHTLDTLAGKLSPASGKNSPQGVDTNGNKLNFNYNTHPYQKPPTVVNNSKVISLNSRAVDNSNPQNPPPVVTSNVIVSYDAVANTIASSGPDAAIVQQ
jgi:hypothetical protein